MALVHCRIGCIHPDVPDGLVVACFSAAGVEEIEPTDLEWYHASPPLSACSCGAPPVAPWREAFERGRETL